MNANHFLQSIKAGFALASGASADVDLVVWPGLSGDCSAKFSAPGSIHMNAQLLWQLICAAKVA